MSRKFKTANYEEILNQTIRLAEALPPEHLARFVVDIIAQLDLSKIYERHAGIEEGGFYPYPIHMAEACKRGDASWFIPPQNSVRGRTLDPCLPDATLSTFRSIANPGFAGRGGNAM